MKKAIITMAVLLMVLGNVGLAQQKINLKSIEKATMLKHYGLRENSDMVPQTAHWQDTYGDKYRVTYEYDEYDYYLITELYEVIWDGDWQAYEMITYEYDFSGNVLELLVQDFDGEEWIDMAKASYSYEGGLLSEVIVQYWEDGEWVNVEKQVYNFNGATSTILYWNWNGNNWSSSELYTYTYGMETVELLKQYMQGGAWQNEEKDTYKIYNNFSTAYWSEILVEKWSNNAWVNDSKTTYDYDENGVFTSKQYAEWNGTAFEEIERYSYTYDDGNAISGSCKVKDGNDFMTGDGEIEMAYGYNADTKFFYGYEVEMTYIDLTGIDEPQTFDFKVYPNPALQNIIIESNDFQKAEIYSVTGQKLMESQMEKMNVGTLPTGVYLLKVYDRSGNAETRKLMVN